mgnify:FL=1
MISYTDNKIPWNRLYQLTQELPTVNRKQEIRELFRLLVPELIKNESKLQKNLQL